MLNVVKLSFQNNLFEIQALLQVSDALVLLRNQRLNLSSLISKVALMSQLSSDC